MKAFVLLLLFLYSVSGLAQNNSFRSIELETIDGNRITMNDFAGKKILLVNSASISPKFEQLRSLKQLYHRFKDSGLVVIVCPSNSFGNEPGSDNEIKQLIKNRFSPDFIVVKKMNVTGENAHNLYKWIGNKNKNGLINGKVNDDFTKFLIGTDGQIKGMFSSQIDPMDPVILNAIRSN
jgi:glutathione peroxidase